MGRGVNNFANTSEQNCNSLLRFCRTHLQLSKLWENWVTQYLTELWTKALIGQSCGSGNNYRYNWNPK